MRVPSRILLPLYTLSALWITWPAITNPARWIPGSGRSDVWNSLWSWWYVGRVLWHGEGLVENTLLNFPEGGNLLVTDLVNGVLAAPLTPLLGLPATWTLLVVAHLVFSGAAAHRLAERLVSRAAGEAPFTGWVAGMGYQAAPVLLSSIHNGTSECVAGGWLPLTLLLGLQALDRGGVTRVLLAALSLAVTALASWYAGLCAFLGLTCLLLLGDAPWRRRASILLPTLLLALLPLLLYAAWVHGVATRPGNLVGIKSPRELGLLRRSTGAADPLGWVMPGDYRAPDFRLLSRYGEDFIHCHYLGALILLGAAWTLSKPSLRRGWTWLGLAGLLGAILSMGPVATHKGQPFVFLDQRALPLPYLLLEGLPGFRDLSLLFRLAQLPALAFALLADRAATTFRLRGRALAPLGALLVFFELRCLSPMAGLPAVSFLPASDALQTLRNAPEGAVMNFPVVGGRSYLYEQTLHERPIAGTLNFPNNFASQAVWRALLAQETLVGETPIDANILRSSLERTLCVAPRRTPRPGGGSSPGGAHGHALLRYLVVHEDPVARPDMHDVAVSTLERLSEPIARDETLRVYDLCPGR